MLYLGIAVHGMCYDFIFVMGRMYVDRHATDEIRGAAQGLHALVTLGIGMFIGSWLSGIVGDHFSIEVAGQMTHRWSSIWLIPAILSLGLVCLFAGLFREPNPVLASDAAPHA